MQKTLILFKPDALERGVVGAILSRFETAGFQMEQCRLLRPPLPLLQEHYADLKDRHPSAFERTTRYYDGRPFLAMVLSAPNGITKARAMAGPTDPSKAPPGTIRGDFSSDTIERADAEGRATFNLIHASDSEASAAREMALWFS
jgi:nucleoside-diphosphate kinase